MRKLFILGCGRSGTTMLQQALNRHPRIVIPPETGYFVDFLGHTRRGQAQHLRRINADLEIELPPPARRVATAGEAVAFYEQLARAYAVRLGRSDAAYFGEKSPRHLLVLPRIHRLFPYAKIILIYRDGRDVALSLCRVPWAPDDLAVNFAIWLRFHRWYQWALDQPGLDRLCVKYEEFVVDPVSHLRRIAEFLDIDYEPIMAEGYGNRNGVPEWEDQWKRGALDRINTSRVAVWRDEMSPRDAALLECWGGDALTSLGYELSCSPPRGLPLTFFPRLWWKHTVWRAKSAAGMSRKELGLT